MVETGRQDNEVDPRDLERLNEMRNFVDPQPTSGSRAEHAETLNLYRDAFNNVQDDVREGYVSLLVDRKIVANETGGVVTGPRTVEEDQPIIPGSKSVTRGVNPDGVPSWVVLKEDHGLPVFEYVPIKTSVIPAKESPIKRDENVVFTAKTEALNEEEEKALDNFEREYVNTVISKVITHARERMSKVTHSNLVPYEKRDMEQLKVEIRSFRSMLEKAVQKGNGSLSSDRAETVLGRLDAINDWVEGNMSMFLVGGPLVNSYFDGWRAIKGAMVSQRDDIEGMDLGKKFGSSLKDAKEGSVAEEIVRKQDQMYKIYRGISGIHKGRARNAGEKLDDNYEYGYTNPDFREGKDPKYDRMVERRRARFVEAVLNHPRAAEATLVNDDFLNEWRDNPYFYKGVYIIGDDGRAVADERTHPNKQDRLRAINEYLKTHKGQEVKLQRRYVETISEVWSGDESRNARSEIKSLMEEPGNENFSQRVLVGKKEVISGDLIKRLAGHKGRSMWVNGVERVINDETLEDLSWRIGSGDSIFYNGEIKEITRKNINDIPEKGDVALLTTVAPELDNVFNMASAKDITDPVRKKLSLMLDENVWDKLADKDTNVTQLIADFRRKLAARETDPEAKAVAEKSRILNEHIVEAGRLDMMIMAEAHELGVGYNYKTDLELWKDPNKKGYDPERKAKTKVITRKVELGGPHTATDLGAPLFWLYSDANNTSKWFQSSMFPMDMRTQKQILDHAPGWAPKWHDEWDDKSWKDNKKFYGVTFKPGELWYTQVYDTFYRTDIPTKFKLTMLDSIYLQEPSDRDRRITGKKKIRPMDLINAGYGMSDIDWSKINDEAQNKWFVTLGKLGNMENIFGNKPDKIVAENYLSDTQQTDTAALQKLNKDLSSALKDLPGGDEYIKMFPHVLALWYASRNGALPDSPAGIRRYDASTFDKNREQLMTLLRKVSPIDNPNFGNIVAARFGLNTVQMKPWGIIQNDRQADVWFSQQNPLRRI